MQRLIALTLLISTLTMTGCMEVMITGLQTDGDANQICANPLMPSFINVTCN
jgi:type III secretory pathway lipoprotein EscJ